MPVDYEEVLRDLDERIAFYEAEIATLKAGRPTIVRLHKATISAPALPELKHRGKYVNWGATAAIRDLMNSTSDLLTREDIHKCLKTEGWTTKSADELSTISATLSQMKDEIEKVEDRWRKKESTRVGVIYGPEDAAKAFGPPNPFSTFISPPAFASPPPAFFQHDSGITDDDDEIPY